MTDTPTTPDLSAWMVDDAATETKDIVGIPTTFRTSLAGKDVKEIYINCVENDRAKFEIETDFKLVQLGVIDPVIPRDVWDKMDAVPQLEIVATCKINAGLIGEPFR